MSVTDIPTDQVNDKEDVNCYGKYSKKITAVYLK